MTLDLLKPLPGWRAFLGEVGIIVLGVLVALAIGEVADDLRWDARAKDTVRSVRTPVRPLTTDSWKQVTASEVLLHIDAEQGRLFTAGYSQVERYTSSVLLETDMWAALRVLENNPGTISETLLADVETTLARLEDKSSQNSIIAKQEFESGRSIGIPASYFLLLDREGTREDAFKHLRDRPICKALIVDGKPFVAGT